MQVFSYNARLPGWIIGNRARCAAVKNILCLTATKSRKCCLRRQKPDGEQTHEPVVLNPELISGLER